VAKQNELRFVSNNPLKIGEAKDILGQHGISVVAVPLKIDELQTTDANKLVHDKVLKAFEAVGRPLFVEHTGLFVGAVNELPGGLTQIFWDSLQAESFTKLFGSFADPTRVIARTSIAFCDGKTIHDFHGEVSGQLLKTPKGPRDFQWDCVFQPDGEAESFAEMGPRKNEISMRRLALEKLANHVKSRVSK
jgi:XTP/dITP diphosphohydrolase